MRVGIIALLHESNTFSSQPTTVTRFREDMWWENHAIRSELAGAHHEVGGFLAGLDAMDKDIEVVPLLATRALPAGMITGEAMDLLTGEVLQRIDSAVPLDGLLVATHGAAVSQSESDADGHWLAVLRQRLGPRVPIVGTLDLHANLSAKMVRSCNALVAYRTNPHLDQRERGQEAARLLVRTIRGEMCPTMSAVLTPVAIGIDRQCTHEPHLKPLYDLAQQQRVNSALSNSILLGFPYADVPEMGAAVLAVTDNCFAESDRVASELSAALWNHRHELRSQMTGIGEALERCDKLTGRICLLDMGDNVGGGSSADGTTLIEALHQRGGGPSLACLYDPDSVRECDAVGVDGTLHLRVGGKTDRLHGEPLCLNLTVRSLHDGRFTEDRPRHGGIVNFNQGRTAVVQTAGGLTLMLTSRRMVPFSLQQLAHCRLDPATYRILVAKGVNAPIAAYREVCDHFIRVNTIGSTCADLGQLEFHQRRRPMFPFEDDFDWCPTDFLVRGFANDGSGP